MTKFEFSRFKPYIFEGLFYLATFLLSILFYVIFEPLYGGDDYIARGEHAKILALVILCVIALTVAILVSKKKFDRKALIFTMIVASFAIRLGYILYTEGVARQHDTWDSCGHFDYAKYIYLTGKLPPENYYQFYHPPLNAFIQANFMKFFQGIFSFANKTIHATSINGGMDMTYEGYYSACQILSLLYVTVITVTACKIFKKLNIEGVGGLIGLAIIIFFPRFIQLSGQLNNDILCIMFCFLALYFAIKVYQNQSYTNIIALAIFVGLAIMTKLNGAMICLPIAVLMLIPLIKRFMGKDKTQIVDITVKYAVFLIICAPLALWFQVYAKIRFDQNFGYVFSNLNGNLSTKQFSIWNRFFVPNMADVFKGPFANAWEDYNLWDYMVKSALFGEFSFWNGTAFAYVAVLLHYLFHFAFITSLIFWFYHRKFEGKKLLDIPVIIFGSLIITLLLSQIYFYIKMPYGCTMDFRYIVAIIIGYAGMTAIMVNDAKNTRVKGFKTLTVVLSFFALGVLASANIFYLVCI